MTISSRKPDDEVGTGRKLDVFEQTAAQAAVLGGGGEAGGLPEPKSPADWRERGAAGGSPGRAPVAIGENSQGQGDKAPAGGASVANARAPDPKPRVDGEPG